MVLLKAKAKAKTPKRKEKGLLKMASYHCQIQAINRKERSMIAVSAYINAKSYTDDRTGMTFDYSNKSGVLYSYAYAIDENNKRVKLDNQELWNKAEHAEKRKDARVGREYIIAIPHELMQKGKRKQGLECVMEYCDRIAKRYNVAIEFAIHDQDNGNKNFHAHILTTTRKASFANGELVLTEKSYLELSDKKLRQLGKKTGKEQITSLRKLNADVSNKHLAKNGFDERVDHRTLDAQGIDRLPKLHLTRAEMELEKRGKKTKKGDYNRLIAEQNAIRKELQEVEKQLSLYVSNSSITHESIFNDDDDDDDDLLVQVTDNKEKDDNAPIIFKTIKPTVTPPKPQQTTPAPTTPRKENNAKNEAVERPAPTVETPKQPIKNNENKAKEVLATKAPTTPPPQAQPSPGAATQQPKNTPTPPIQEPPKQAKTAQQQPLQTKPTPPQPPRPLKDDRAEDKAPVKPPIATQEPPPQEQQKPLTAYDRPINQYYDILATHKRSFAKQNDISTVKKLYPSDSPIYLNFMNDKGSISLNKGKQKTDLHFEIYKRFREVADKATSEIKRTSEVIRNYMTLTVNQFTARYNIELTDSDRKDIESKDRLLKIDDFKNNYVEKEKPQLTPTITNTGQLKPKI